MSSISLPTVDSLLDAEIGFYLYLLPHHSKFIFKMQIIHFQKARLPNGNRAFLSTNYSIPFI